MTNSRDLTGPIVSASDLPIVDDRAGDSITVGIRARYRRINWGLYRSRLQPETVYILTCTQCPESSGPSTSLDPSQVWAIEHGAQTGHDGFHEDMRTYWLVRTAGADALAGGAGP